MHERAARAATLLQAFETAQPPSPNWGDDDRAWATRLATQDDPADVDSFIARRAHHAMQRLGGREPAAAKWLDRRLWHPGWIGAALLVGLVLGLLADSVGASQRINLLAPPLWAVLVWNLVVYLVLLGQALAQLLMRRTRPGALVRVTQRLMRIGLPRPAVGGSAPALGRFAGLWFEASRRLSAARASTLLHAAAATLAAGLIAGLYLRGLVLDYRAAWESTFLSPATAHAALSIVLGPASALSGIGLPDVASFARLRESSGAAGSGGPAASAAPWIHLLASTLLLFVVLPRGVLGVGAALRARWLSGHMTLPLADPYFGRLARLRHGDQARVVVVPYASTPTPQAVLGLQAVLAPTLGDAMQLRVAPTAAFGAEDDTPPRLDADVTHAIALFDLSATPEAETHGRFVRQLATRAPVGAATLVFVDETAFRARFAGDSMRLAQRREAWRIFARSLGTPPVCAHLAAPEAAAAAEALQHALREPVARVLQ